MSIKISEVWQYLTRDLMDDARNSRPSPNMGMMQLLLSQENIAATRGKLGDIIAPQDGKYYKILRTVFPRVSYPDDTDDINYCPTDGERIKPIVDAVEIKYVHKSPDHVIDNEILRCIKMSKQEYTSKVFLNAFRDHINKLGPKVAARVAELRGNFVRCDCDDAFVTNKNLPLFRADGIQINPVGMQVLQNDRLESEIAGEFVIVGGTIINAYRDFKGLQVGNDVGYDASKIGYPERSVFYDTNLAAALGGANEVLAYTLGAMRLVTHNKNIGEFVEEFDDHARYTITDPWFNLRHDVIFNVQKCGEEIMRTYKFITYYDVIPMHPCWAGNDDQGDCRFFGVNDVFHYTVTCADIAACNIAPNCGVVGINTETNLNCDKTLICVTACKANFVFNCFDGAVHTVTSTATEVSGIQINGGAIISLSGVFDLTDEASSAAFAIALADALAAYSSVTASSVFYDGTPGSENSIVTVMTDASVVEIVLVVDNAANEELDRLAGELIRIVSTSKPSTGATLSNLSWQTPTGNFGGAPTEVVAESGYAGTMQDFTTTTTNEGAFQLSIVDSDACTDVTNQDVLCE